MYKYRNVRIAILVLNVCSYLCVLNFYAQGISADGGRIVSNSNIGFIRGDHLPDSFLKSDKKVIEYENIEGSPYINNDSDLENGSPIGKVYTLQNEFLGTAFARYNAYTDFMEVSLTDNGVDYYLLEKKPEDLYIILGTKKYSAYQHKTNATSEVNYFVLISENDSNYCVLLKREHVLFKKESAAESSFLSATPAHFTRSMDTYHLKFNDNSIVDIPKKTKDFLKLFTIHQEKIKTFITTNKLKLKDEAAILSVVNYFNSLSN